MTSDIQAVVDLLSRVPLAPEDQLPPGVSTDDITSFEARWQVRLPTSFCEWLKITNGPCIGPGGLFGICTARADLDIARHWTTSPEWLSSGWVPVAADGSGGYFMMLLGSGASRIPNDDAPIALLDTNWSPSELSYAVSSGLWHFLKFLMNRELGSSGGWPFQKEYVLQHDPRLAEVRGIPLPWEVA